MEAILSALVVLVAALVVIYSRPIATYFVENNTTPFTFLHPQDRIPREDRPEKLEEHQRARDFWRPFMRGFVVLMALVVGLGAAANLVDLAL